MTLSTSVVCPVLIGRSEDLSVLHGLAERAAQGHGQTALIAGEAGLGKSRLAREAAQAAEQLGLHLVQGNCFEIDRTLPFGPWLDLLRNFQLPAASPDPARALPSTDDPLLQLLAELSAALPAAASAPTLEPEQEKRRLFHALARFLFEQSHQKLVIVIEDLHWCDETSLEFLLYLVRRMQDRSILLVLTYRDDEAGAGLRHFLAELDRARLGTELRLSRLSAGEVDEMLRTIFALNRPVRSDFLNVLFGLTDGNPFFIEEILKSLIEAGGIFYADGAWDRKPIEELSIPRSIQDAVGRRAETLSPRAQEVVSIAAVIGQRFDFPLLLELSGVPETELLKILKELIAAQLIVEQADDHFAFRHALTREAISSRLIERERKALHHKIGEALERQAGAGRGEQTGSLAHHFFEAGDWAKAMEYSRRAGESARSLQAPRPAVAHYGQAIEAGQRLGLPSSAELHQERAAAYSLLGEFDRARADYETALRAAQAAGDRAHEWRILLDLGLLWAGRDYSQTGEYYQRAYDLARTAGDGPMIAHSLNRLGNWNVNLNDPLKGLRLHEEALQIFEAQGDARGLAETLDLLGMANYIGSDALQSEVYYEQAVVRFRELGDRQGLASSLASKMLNSSHLQSGMAVITGRDAEIGMRDGEEALKLTREIGWRSGETYALITLGSYHALKGRYGRASELLNASLQLAEEIEHSQWILYSRYCLGSLSLDLQDLHQARSQLEAALALAREIGSRWWITNVTGFLALSLLQLGEPEQAAAALDAALGTVVGAVMRDRRDIQAVTMGERLCWAAAAEIALAGGDAAAAWRVVEQLLAASTHLAEGISIPRLALLASRVLAAQKRFEEADRMLQAARTVAEREREMPILWRIHAAAGKVYQLQSQREQAKEASSRAQAVVAELAEAIPDATARREFLERAQALIPRVRPASTRQAEKKAYGGLTAREREVASMIAAGKSNREMAQALVVGERTVETHVSNILGKLGFASRAQIAAWAAARGLSAEEES